jgi:hypothetical protein
MPAGSSGPVNSIRAIDLNIVALIFKNLSPDFILTERCLKLDRVMIVEMLDVLQLFFDLQSF